MRDEWKKWMPLVAFGLFLIGGIVFLILMLKPKKIGDGASYIDGFNEIAVGETHYVMINDIEAESFVGSGVGDFVKVKRGEKVTSITGGFMTLCILYKVEGDNEDRYLSDSNGRLYAKKDIAEAEKARLSDWGIYTKHKIIDSDKNSGEFHDITEEQYGALLALCEEQFDAINIDDKQIAEEFDNRREVFAFTEDEMAFRACAELFLYNNEVYVTIAYVNAKNSKTKKAILTGKKLTDGMQKEFRYLWP